MCVHAQADDKLQSDIPCAGKRASYEGVVCLKGMPEVKQLAQEKRYCEWTKSVRTTLKPWETRVCWYLKENRIIPRFLRWCEMDFVHPQWGHFPRSSFTFESLGETLPPRHLAASEPFLLPRVTILVTENGACSLRPSWARKPLGWEHPVTVQRCGAPCFRMGSTNASRSAAHGAGSSRAAGCPSWCRESCIARVPGTDSKDISVRVSLQKE